MAKDRTRKNWYDLMRDTDIYLVSYHFGRVDQSGRFLKNGIWDQGGEASEAIRNVKPGSVLLLKTTSASIKSLTIKGAGIVTKNPRNGKGLVVNWKHTPDQFAKVTLPNLGADYSGKIHQVQNTHIQLIVEYFGPIKFESLFKVERSSWELLYYWIKEEHTYQRSGLNLSNRFKISFNDEIDNPTLSITEGEHHLENFFGNHVINLTAVIGENGAGKTNLMYSLISRLVDYQKVYGSQYILIFYADNRLFIYETLTTNGPFQNLLVKSDFHHVVIPYENERTVFGQPDDTSLLPSETGLIYFNPIYDLRDYPFQNDSREFADVSSTYLLWRDGQNKNIGDYDMVALHRSEEIKRQFRMTQSPFLKEDGVVAEIRLPTELEVEVLKTDWIEENDLGPQSKRLWDLIRNYGRKVYNSQAANIDMSSRPSNAYSEALKAKSKTWFLVNFFDHFFYCYADQKDLDDEMLGLEWKDFPFFVDNKIGSVDQLINWPSMSVEGYINMVLFFFENQTLIIKDEYDIVTNVKKALKLIEKSADVTVDNEAKFNFPFEPAFEFLAICDQYARAFKNEYRESFVRVQWRNISSGELGFLNLFSRIFLGYTQLLNDDTPPEKIPRTIYLLIDEGEHGFHPHWQKVYIKTLLEFLEHFKGIKFQIFVTSHSPIMLSDIPKSNVIFLRKGTEGAQPITPENISETFGSNIHVLFRDSFFLREGLVGAFAQRKIEEIFEKVERLKESITEKELSSLLKEVELIGEPILKNTLKERITALSSDAAAIRFYEREIERIKSRQKNDSG